MKINKKFTEFVDKLWCIISPNHYHYYYFLLDSNFLPMWKAKLSDRRKTIIRHNATKLRGCSQQKYPTDEGFNIRWAGFWWGVSSNPVFIFDCACKRLGIKCRAKAYVSVTVSEVEGEPDVNTLVRIHTPEMHNHVPDNTGNICWSKCWLRSSRILVLKLVCLFILSYLEFELNLFRTHGQKRKPRCLCSDDLVGVPWEVWVRELSTWKSQNRLLPRFDAFKSDHFCQI